MGFFAKSKNADTLLLELDKKIEKAKEELGQIEEKIKVIDNQQE
jgi:ABC-type Fe3+-hydroxamate transport system substrate-binding protein